MNVHSPEEVCVPLCQMLSCLDKRPLKQTEMSCLIIGFHVAWFCKCSFHIFSLFKVEQICRNQAFFFSFSPLEISIGKPCMSSVDFHVTYLAYFYFSLSWLSVGIDVFYMSVRPMAPHSVFQRVHIQTLCNVHTADICIHTYWYCRIGWFLNCT